MITDRLDPPGLLRIPEIVNVSVATGSRIIHVSGQTAVDTEGKVVGTTHVDQCRHALRNLRTALEAAGATLDDVAKYTIYMVDYSWNALTALVTAGKEVLGDPYPLTANTLVGVLSALAPGTPRRNRGRRRGLSCRARSADRCSRNRAWSGNLSTWVATKRCPKWRFIRWASGP
jgi:enamine deaminase RidA (YjgF/YER057c/UK114 family)